VFREYPMGHEIRPEALREIVRWLEERVLSPVLRA
jgi:predicted esterase